MLHVLGSKGQRSRSRDVKTSIIWRYVYYGVEHQRKAPTARYAYAIFRRTGTVLSAPETLGNGRTAAYRVSACGHLLFCQ